MFISVSISVFVFDFINAFICVHLRSSVVPFSFFTTIQIGAFHQDTTAPPQIDTASPLLYSAPVTIFKCFSRAEPLNAYTED
jgi:hypothetical protein